MEISQERLDDTYHFIASGNLTMDDVAVFRPVLKTTVEPGINKILFNMSGVDYIDLDGLKILRELAVECNHCHVELTIEKPTDFVEDFICTTGMEKIFTISKD